MTASASEQLAILQDLRNAQVARDLAEDRLGEYEQAEQDWQVENVRMTDVCAHNWQEINRLNSDIRRVTRARQTVEREQAQERAAALAAARELDGLRKLVAGLEEADRLMLRPGFPNDPTRPR